MKYSNSGIFLCHKAMNILQALKEAPRDYLVYAQHADSIYPITGVSDLIIDDAVSFSSIETYGDPPPVSYTVAELFQMTVQLFGDNELDPYMDICLEAAEHVNTELEIQMDHPCEIDGWAVDDTCCHFYLIAGGEWGWTS